jgi:hypothetical protein
MRSRDAGAIAEVTVPLSRVVFVLTCTLAALALCSIVAADSIYMKTGTVIRTAKATIDGEAVIFQQYGSQVVIPLTLVERVVPDDHTGPVAITRNVRGRSSEAGESSDVSASGAESATGQRESADATSPTRATVPPEETKEYWQERVRALHYQGELLEARLKELRRIERAFLFSHRSTADSRRQIEEVQRAIEDNEQAKRDLRREARREGVPPGWLRVRGITY